MKDIEKFYSLITELQVIARGKRRKTTLLTELSKEEHRLLILNDKVEKEYEDIVLLESKPIIHLFSNILKNRQKQLEKERQEYLLAVLEYRECKNVIELLKFELEIINSKVSNESLIKNEINFFFSEKKYAHITNQDLKITDLKNVMIRLNNLSQLKIETSEVLEISNEILATLYSMLDKLKKAREFDNWGTFYKEIQQGKALKKSYLDEAQEHSYLIKKLVIFLNSEFKDIIKIQNKFEYNKPYLLGFNLNYYADLIEDWVNDSNLSETFKHTLYAHSSITKLRRDLNKLIEETIKKTTMLEAKRIVIIESI